MRLNVCVVRAEQPRHALDRQTLYLIDVLTAAVVARAGIALGVFVRQVAANSLHDALALQLARHGSIQLRVCLHQVCIIHIGNLRYCQFSPY